MEEITERDGAKKRLVAGFAPKAIACGRNDGGASQRFWVVRQSSPLRNVRRHYRGDRPERVSPEWSRLPLAQESRQRASWLSFDVGRRKEALICNSYVARLWYNRKIMIRVLSLPIVTFIFVAAVLRIVGSMLLLTLPSERTGATFSEMLGGMTAATIIAIAMAWLFVKVWKWRPDLAQTRRDR